MCKQIKTHLELLKKRFSWFNGFRVVCPFHRLLRGQIKAPYCVSIRKLFDTWNKYSQEILLCAVCVLEWINSWRSNSIENPGFCLGLTSLLKKLKAFSGSNQALGSFMNISEKSVLHPGWSNVILKKKEVGHTISFTVNVCINYQ